MAKKKNNLINNFERDILRLLDKTLIPLSVNAVAEKLDISYNTAKKYLYSLLEKNLIEEANDDGQKANKKNNPKRKNSKIQT